MCAAEARSKGSIVPSPSQFDTLMAMDDGFGPVVMINMLKFREQADYSDHPEQSPCSGREAYDRYSEAITSTVMALGGKPVWLSDVEHVFIAPENEQWDQVILVHWPSLGAFKALINNKEYLKSSFHRDSATEDTRLIIASTLFADFE